MRTSDMLVLSMAVCLIMGFSAYSSQPDNAAVLYREAAEKYQTKSEIQNLLVRLTAGEIDVNDNIREFVAKNRPVINTLLNAAQIENCDWGLDYSKGWELEMPMLADIRRLAHLVSADAMVLAHDRNYETSFKHCISIYKMARHVNNRVLVSFLVAISLNEIANRCLTQIINDMPQDTQNLMNLKNKLIEIENIPLSLKPAILGERDMVLKYMTNEQLAEMMRPYYEDENFNNLKTPLDSNAVSRNKEYLADYYADIIATIDMPYEDAVAPLGELDKKIDFNNPDAILTNLLRPAIQRIFSMAIRAKTHDNAAKAAVELYLIKAKTGKLPDVLPAGLPLDLFSDKPFIYEKTADGFTLRCQGKDLTKDEAYEYKFKVNK